MPQLMRHPLGGTEKMSVEENAMKPLFTVILITIAIVICSCKKDSKDSIVNDNKSISETISNGLSGTAIVEGRVGYFSPALPPDPDKRKYAFIYPGGYLLGECHWITTDTPKVSKWVYINEDCSNLENHYVRITGNWNEVIKTIGTDSYRYIILSVDSLQSLE